MLWNQIWKRKYYIYVTAINIHGAVGEIEIFLGDKLIKKYFLYSLPEGVLARFLHKLKNVLKNVNIIYDDMQGPSKFLVTYYYLKWRKRERQEVGWPKWSIKKWKQVISK